MIANSGKKKKVDFQYVCTEATTAQAREPVTLRAWCPLAEVSATNDYVPSVLLISKGYSTKAVMSEKKFML